MTFDLPQDLWPCSRSLACLLSLCHSQLNMLCISIASTSHTHFGSFPRNEFRTKVKTKIKATKLEQFHAMRTCRRHMWSQRTIKRKLRKLRVYFWKYDTMPQRICDFHRLCRKISDIPFARVIEIERRREHHNRAHTHVTNVCDGNLFTIQFYCYLRWRLLVQQYQSQHTNESVHNERTELGTSNRANTQ